MYTAHAHCSGFVIPRAYALLPNKTAETYSIMWEPIRANIGQEAADLDRLVTIDFEIASIGAASAAFPGVRFAGCYFYLGQPVYLQVHQLGLQRKYASDAEFQLRAKMIPAIAFLLAEDVVAGLELLEALFADDEQPLCAYFEANYIGRRVGGARRKPRFGLGLWNVRNRMEAGALRTNNSVEAPHDGFATGVSGGDHQPLWTYVGNLHSKQNITDKDLADVDLGTVKPEGKKQALRNQRMWTLVARYLKDRGVLRLLRGVARIYQ